MTAQSQQNSITSEMGSRTLSADTLLNLDDDLVVISAGSPTLTLPDARQIPGKEISVKSEPGTGTLDTILGQTIDTAPTFSFSNPLEGLILQSDGANWQIVGSDGQGAAVTFGSPVTIGTTNQAGAAVTVVRSDHVHAHGDQPGGSLHATVIAAGAAGFMSGADKTKLNGLPASIAFATPVEISDSANAEGASANFVRADHVHAHGNRGGGSLHALAIAGGAAGFMSGADQTKLNSISGGAGPRLYDAVVDAAGGGDFLLPSAAFASGASSVFVRGGTYTETADIEVPASGCLVGECPGGIIIILGAFSLVMDGSARLTTTGTVATTSGSATITGTGTLFTNLLADDYILLGDKYTQIDSILNDTSLDLVAPYRGGRSPGRA